jgi:hypothetical protein
MNIAMMDSNKLFTEVVSNLLEENGHQIIANLAILGIFLSN